MKMDNVAKSKEEEEAAMPSSSESEEINGSEEAKNVGRKRTIDETKLDPEEARKLESRRAYNRQCAAKARKRNKDLVAHLQLQVEELTKDKAELKRNNDVMRAQLSLLVEQNRTLMINQLGGGIGGFGLGLGGGLASSNPAFMGSGVVGNRPSVSLIDRLAADRAAQFQALQQQRQGGNLNDLSSNGANNAGVDETSSKNDG